MLITGATPAHAKPGKNPRCAGYSGQAKSICTAAVAKGCFAGVEKPVCDKLVAHWTNHCKQCGGNPPPWHVCPCTFDVAQLESYVTGEIRECVLTQDQNNDNIFAYVARPASAPLVQLHTCGEAEACGDTVHADRYCIAVRSPGEVLDYHADLTQANADACFADLVHISIALDCDAQ